MKTPAFHWPESPLSNPTFWAGAFEVLTYTRDFHYELGNRFEAGFNTPKAPGALLVSTKYVASDPETGFREPYAVEVKIPLSALLPDSDEAALDYLVDALKEAIDERAIRRDYATWRAHQAREHADIQAHNRGLDAWLRGGG